MMLDGNNFHQNTPDKQMEMDKDYYLTYNNNGQWMPPEFNQSTIDSVGYQDSIF